jgi:hypothetical protein
MYCQGFCIFAHDNKGTRTTEEFLTKGMDALWREKDGGIGITGVMVAPKFEVVREGPSVRNVVGNSDAGV